MPKHGDHRTNYDKLRNEYWSEPGNKWIPFTEWYGHVLSGNFMPSHGEHRYNSSKDTHEFWDANQQKWVEFEEWYRIRIELEKEKIVVCKHEFVNVGFNSIKMVCKKCNVEQTEEDLINLKDYGIFEEEVI